MKRILQISNYFFPHIGGIEKVARDIADAVCADGHYEQKIICFNEDAAAGQYRCRRRETVHELINGVEVVRCGTFGKVSSQSLSLTFRRELARIMNDFKPDVVIFHYPNPFEAHFLLKYLKRDFHFVVYWHLDIVKQKFLGKLFQRQTRRLLQRADQIIATSPLYVEGSPFLRQYKPRCRIIPNCISDARMIRTEAVCRKANRIRQEQAGKIICFAVGRHVPYKGMEYLVKASKLLDERFRIFIGGQGELTEMLKKEAAGDDKIAFLGRLPEEELLACYLAMDIFCFPSITKNEAFGIALAEGMYWGKPAVTFTIPGSGVNYVCRNGKDGLEVANRDIEAYAEALKKLADDPELRARLGASGKKRAEENFLTSRFRSNIINLLTSMQL